MLVANILTMLRSKNTRNSGKRTLALPLQHSNYQFLDIFEIGVTERAGNELGFKHVSTPRILDQDWRDGLQECIATGGTDF